MKKDFDNSFVEGRDFLYYEKMNKLIEEYMCVIKFSISIKFFIAF